MVKKHDIQCKSLYFSNFSSTLCVTSTAPQAFLLFWGLLNDLHAFKTSHSKFWKPSRCSSSTTILKSTIVHNQKPHSGRKKVTCGSHFHWGRTLSEIWIIRTATPSIPRSNASSNWRRRGWGWSWTLDVLDLFYASIYSAKNPARLEALPVWQKVWHNQKDLQSGLI